MLIKVFGVLSMLSMLHQGVLEEEGGGASGLLNKGGGKGGGGGNRLPGSVTKQAVEFPQVLASVL